MDRALSLAEGRCLEEVEDPDGDAEEQAVARLEAVRLRRQLAALSVLERTVLRWRYGIGGEQLARREVAARLGTSVGVVRGLEQRALESLRLAYGLSEAA